MDAAAVIQKEYNKPITRGKNNKYDNHVKPYLQEIKQWIQEGYTDYSIADKLMVTPQSFCEYKKKYVELIECYTQAQAERNSLVMNKMFAKSTGIKERIKKQKVLNNGSVVEFEEEIYVPPCHNASDLFLRNNDPAYKGAKDIGNVTLNQYNFNRPQLERELQKLNNELKQLESVETTDVQVIDDGGK